MALFVSTCTAKTMAIPTKAIGPFIVDTWVEEKSTGIGTYGILCLNLQASDKNQAIISILLKKCS